MQSERDIIKKKNRMKEEKSRIHEICHFLHEFERLSTVAAFLLQKFLDSKLECFLYHCSDKDQILRLHLLVLSINCYQFMKEFNLLSIKEGT